MSTAEAAPQAAPTRWEYKVWSEGVRARLDSKRFEMELNKLGAEGWEMFESSGDDRLFKRPLLP